MVMPLCSDGVNDMFTESKVYLQKYQSAINHKKSPQDRFSRGLVLKNRRKQGLLLFQSLS